MVNVESLAIKQLFKICSYKKVENIGVISFIHSLDVIGWRQLLFEVNNLRIGTYFSCK